MLFEPNIQTTKLELETGTQKNHQIETGSIIFHPPPYTICVWHIYIHENHKNLPFM